MVRRGVASVLNAKIVDDKRGHYGQVGGCPERQRVGDGGIAMFGKMLSDAVVGNVASLLEAGHGFLDIEVYPSGRDKFKKVLLRDDQVRNGVEGQTHVLVAVHRCII